MKRIILVAVVASLIALPWQAGAAKVKTWHHYRPADHERGERKGVVETDSGALKLSRRLMPLAKLDCSHVWAVAEDKSGNVFAATGDEGKVYKVTPAGKASVVYEGDAAQVLSLAADAKGEVVYAGTGPTGRVVRIDGSGAKVLCELPESYVWALAADPKGGFYAATGPNGRVYKVGADGKAKVFYETKQDHVLCLAVAADGTVYVGTDKTGRVYRIDPKGKGFVVYQAAQSEVHALLLTDDAVYAGTSATKKRGGSGGSASSGSTTAKATTKEDAVRVYANAKADRAADEKKAEKDKDKDKDEKKEEKKSASAPSAPASGENSVYRIANDGGVREVFRDKVLVLGLAKAGKRVLVATGMAGQLFEIDERSRERTELARLDHGQLTSLLVRKDGSVLVAAGDPGALYVLEDRYRAKGEFTSDVLDAKLVAKWGAMNWRADVPEKTKVSVRVRSGNVATPDETWSEWGAETADFDSAKADAPAARYLQYRVSLTSDDPAVTPTLKSLTVRYATTNQAPEVTKVEVPDLSAAPAKNPKKMKFEWSATDANEDELRYRLLVQKDGWKDWVELEDDLEKAEYEWDTTTTPSGTYRLKVVASDRTDNPAKEALTGERVSEPFVVCHEVPKVQLKRGLVGFKFSGSEAPLLVVDPDAPKQAHGDELIVAFASSPLVRLTSAAYSVDGGKWKNAFPKDGLFDSKKETFELELTGLKAGTHVIVLKVTDAAGNTGSGDLVFEVPTKKK